jgi:hypothetical protein
MKFAKSDKDYLERRKAFSAKYGERELWSVIDHWPLYSGVSNLARQIAIADIFRSTLTVPGHIAEFGSWRGANVMYLAKLLRIFDSLGSKQVHCFESFEGLSTFTPQDGASESERGRYKGSYQELVDAIELYDMQDDILIHKGLVQDTLATTLAAQPELTFSFVYCDVDLYEPTKLILEQMDERLAKGGVFVLDEYNDESYPGETMAVREFLASTKNTYSMEYLPHARQPNLVLRKS